jgi:hypothetical protein
MLSSQLCTDLPSVGFSRQVPRLNILYLYIQAYIYTYIHTFKSIYILKSKKYITKIKLLHNVFCCVKISTFRINKSSLSRAHFEHPQIRILLQTRALKLKPLTGCIKISFFQYTDTNICPAIIRSTKYVYKHMK